MSGINNTSLTNNLTPSVTQEVALKIQLRIPHSFTPGIMVYSYQNAWASTALQIICYAYHKLYSPVDNELEFLDRVGLYLNEKIAVKVTERIAAHEPKKRQLHHRPWWRGKMERQHKRRITNFDGGRYCILCGSIVGSEVLVWFAFSVLFVKLMILILLRTINNRYFARCVQ